MKAHTHLSVLTLALIALPSCGGGGGGGGGGGLKLDSFTEDTFAYEDSHDPDFNPLGDGNFRAARKEELAVLEPNENGTYSASVWDDKSSGYKRFGNFGPGLFEKGFIAVASAAGSLDANLGDDLAVLGRRGDDLELVALTSDRKGQWSLIGKTRIPGGASLGVGSVVTNLADVDGDKLDEIIVSLVYGPPNKLSGGWVRVYDDPQGGFQLLHVRDVAGCGRLEAVPCDMEDDGTSELLVFSQEANRAVVRLLEGKAKRFAPRSDWMPIDRYSCHVVIGNFDRDDKPELGAIILDGIRKHCPAVAKTYDLSTSELKLIETQQVYGADPDAPNRPWGIRGICDAVAVDTNGNGIDEIATFLWHAAGHANEYEQNNGILALWSPADDRGKSVGTVARAFIYDFQPDRATLAARDASGDDWEEIALATAGADRSFLAYRFSARESSGTPTLTGQRFMYNISGRATAGLVAAGDFDRDNLVLRSTGRKWTSLANPMPIVVMAAPPTKFGIAQNRNASASSYGQWEGSGQTHGFSVGFSASLSYGSNVDLGFFSSKTKQTLRWQMEKTLKKTTTQTVVKTYAGSYDNDVIVFQGTLYQVYEYDIVGAPDEKAIGTKMTLNDPVMTKSFKWPLDHYNETMAKQGRMKALIGQDIFTHEVGKPPSYRPLSAAKLLVQPPNTKDPIGWVDEEGMQVGLGGGSTSTWVKIAETKATETFRRFSVDTESEMTIGSEKFGIGFTASCSFGVSKAKIYSVTVMGGTTYRGAIGDIEDPDQWNEWGYTCGLLVYRHGGKLPFDVIDYWVGDLGPGYRRQ